jgi:hypothetical protein
MLSISASKCQELVNWKRFRILLSFLFSYAGGVLPLDLHLPLCPCDCVIICCGDRGTSSLWKAGQSSAEPKNSQYLNGEKPRKVITIIWNVQRVSLTFWNPMSCRRCSGCCSDLWRDTSFLPVKIAFLRECHWEGGWGIHVCWVNVGYIVVWKAKVGHWGGEGTCTIPRELTFIQKYEIG